MAEIARQIAKDGYRCRYEIKESREAEKAHPGKMSGKTGDVDRPYKTDKVGKLRLVNTNN